MLIEFLVKSISKKFPNGFLGNVAWQYSSSILSLSFNFAYTLLLGRYLGKSEFGLFTLGISCSTLAFNIFEFRLHEAVQKYVSEYLEKDDVESSLSVIYSSLILDFITGGIAFIILCLVSPWLQSFVLKDPRGTLIVIISAVSVLFGNIGSVTAVGLLRVFHQYQWITITAISSAALKFFTTLIGITIFKLNLISILYLSVACSLLSNLYLIIATFSIVDKNFSLFSRKIKFSQIHEKTRQILGFIVSNYFISILESGYKEVDIWILGTITSSENVGGYKIAKSFSILVAQLTAPVTFVILPEISKLYSRGSFKECRVFIRRLSISLLGLSLVSLIASLYIVPVLIKYFLGTEYLVSISIFQWTLLWIPFAMPLMWAHPLACASNRPNLYLISSLIGNIVALSLYFLLIPSFKEVGASISYSIGLSFTSITAAWLTWKYCLSKDIIIN